MNYKKIIERAEKMAFKFLFYTPEYQENFLKNIEKNIVVDNTKSILFIDGTGEELEVFWAGETMNDVIKGLQGLNDDITGGKKLLIKCGEDKSSIGLVNQVIPYFMEKGGTIKSHTIGYMTRNLNVFDEFPLVSKGELKDQLEIFKVVDDTLGKEKFGMELDEVKDYILEDNKCLYVIKAEDKIVGIVFGYIYGDGKLVFIRGLGVDEKYRGLGYSKQLLSQVFAWAGEKGVEKSMLWVEKSNEIAISLYNKYGYYPYGDQEVKLYYTI